MSYVRQSCQRKTFQRKKMDEWFKTVLNDESVETDFYYCNAHFLLGFYSAADKATTEKEN